MANQYQAAQLAELTAWAHDAAQQLKLEPLAPQDIDCVLSAAAQASAGLVRSAGPVAMYLAGVLVATGQAPDVASACRLVGQLLAIPRLSGFVHDVEHTPQRVSD